MSLHYPSTRILILAKAPLPGLAKTRLIPALGPEGAARLAARMLQQTLTEARAADVGPVTLWVAPDLDDPVWAPYRATPELTLRTQAEGDLGRRMAQAAREELAQGQPVLLIGTDCPPLTRQRLREAACALQDHDSALFPTEDGGYALLGLRRMLESLFERMPWSTPAVATLTRQRIAAAGLSLWQGETLWDVDEPRDLRRLS